MSITGFLSIWISNTATTSMILPIVISIVKELVKINPLFSDEPCNRLYKKILILTPFE